MCFDHQVCYQTSSEKCVFRAKKMKKRLTIFFLRHLKKARFRVFRWSISRHSACLSCYWQLTYSMMRVHIIWQDLICLPSSEQCEDSILLFCFVVKCTMKKKIASRCSSTTILSTVAVVPLYLWLVSTCESRCRFLIMLTSLTSIVINGGGEAL